jgi:hypothetical protein
MRAHVKIAPGQQVKANDYLANAGNGAVPLPGDGPGAFALVVDPTPSDKAADGSYRVRCEMLLRNRYGG